MIHSIRKPTLRDARVNDDVYSNPSSRPAASTHDSPSPLAHSNTSPSPTMAPASGSAYRCGNTAWPAASHRTPGAMRASGIFCSRNRLSWAKNRAAVAGTCCSSGKAGLQRGWAGLLGGAEVDEAVAPVEFGEVFEGGWRGEVDFVDVGG
jgi:hypothetical protein